MRRPDYQKVLWHLEHASTELSSAHQIIVDESPYANFSAELDVYRKFLRELCERIRESQEEKRFRRIL